MMKHEHNFITQWYREVVSSAAHKNTKYYKDSLPLPPLAMEALILSPADLGIMTIGIEMSREVSFSVHTIL